MIVASLDHIVFLASYPTWMRVETFAVKIRLLTSCNL